MTEAIKESTTEATPTPAEEKAETAGTTSILFPELAGEASLPVEGMKEVAKEAEPTAPKETEAKYLNDFSYKVKTKINGEEGEVTVDELKRGYQTAQHLTKEGQRLAEERRRIEQDRFELDKLRNPDKYEYNPYSEMEKTEEQKRIERIEQEFSMLAPMLGNIKYQEDLKVLDTKMRQEGLEDFTKYIPAIEQHILQHPIEQQGKFKTYEFYESFYKTEKLKELQSMVSKKKVPDERVKPNVVPVEMPSSNTASTDGDGYSSKKETLFKKAKETGRNDDWQDYFEFINQSGRLFQRPA